ncbi:hypothetical protein [Rhizobium leguminosarum]|uniref:ORC-CDC6 family AAA ATPase n=1 Tax=Rhizobium leguminosarum TaxID=384 RepID=UPI003D7C1D93
MQNVFATRNSELSSPDEEFAQNFAADALQVLPGNAFGPGALIIRSAPGGGKTSLLRMFTPGPLEQATRNRTHAPFNEIYQRLEEIGAVGSAKPKLLGVYISSNGGYPEIGPPLSKEAAAGLFKALLNARIILRTLRAVSRLAGIDYDDQGSLARIRIGSKHSLREQGQIPAKGLAPEFRAWAEDIEMRCLRYLDTLTAEAGDSDLPAHIGIDAIQWLASASIFVDDAPLACSPLLMIDDVQRLRPWQRDALFSESMEHRTTLILWIAEQTKVLDPSGMLTASRHERDHQVIQLERVWADRTSKFHQFAMAIADRRLRQAGIEVQFDAVLSSTPLDRELLPDIENAVAALKGYLLDGPSSIPKYEAWIDSVLEADNDDPFRLAVELGKTRILIARDSRKSTASMEFEAIIGPDPIPSGVSQAAERFVTRDYGLPYYYGVERIARLATFNIEEFLQICAGLFETIHANRVIRGNTSSAVSASAQHSVIKKLAERRYKELSRGVRYGELAQRLVEAVGMMAKEKTYSATAPYAPGVTGFAISPEERVQLAGAVAAGSSAVYHDLAQVITACVAQNILDMREVRQGSRTFTVFYLNRMLCAHFDLVYHYGGWQRVPLRTLINWANGRGTASDFRKLL